MFFQKTKKQEIETTKYKYDCLTCGMFDFEQKLDYCHTCKGPIVEPYEHINRKGGLGYTYYYSCHACKITFDAIAEDKAKDKDMVCPRCQNPSVSDGFRIACGGRPRGFIANLLWTLFP